jgi:hypothetical protein
MVTMAHLRNYQCRSSPRARNSSVDGSAVLRWLGMIKVDRGECCDRMVDRLAHQVLTSRAKPALLTRRQARRLVRQLTLIEARSVLAMYQAGKQTPQAPRKTPINRTSGGLSHGFW